MSGNDIPEVSVQDADREETEENRIPEEAGIPASSEAVFSVLEEMQAQDLYPEEDKLQENLEDEDTFEDPDSFEETDAAKSADEHQEPGGEQAPDAENEAEGEEIPDKPDYVSELCGMIRSGMPDEELKDSLADYHENDIADVLAELTPDERGRLYRLLGMETVSEVFAYLGDEAEPYLEELNVKTAAAILEKMDSDDAVDILDELDEEKSSEIRELMDEEARQDIDLIQSYDEDKIGSRMTTNFITIRRGSTVRQAMRSMIDQASENDNISTLYVVDGEKRFCGAIDLKDLIIAREFTDLEELIVTSYPYVYAEESVSECIEQLKNYSEDSIPVLDSDNRILGVLTSWDVVEAVDEELGEDYAKMAGLTEEEDLEEPLSASLKKRLPWLITLLFLGLIVSSVVGVFEPLVAQLTIVVSFQSVILGMAGNVGTQSLGVTIRVLMDEGLTFRQELGLVWKEMKVGFVNSLLLALLSFIVAGLYIMFLKGKSPMFSFAVSGCIGISLILSMVISSMMGTLIPILFKRIGIDPAAASGPLISTVNDLVAVLSYYGLVWILLINLLQLVE